MRNLSIVKRIITKPPYECPSHFCLTEHSSCICFDKAKDGEGGQWKIIRLNTQQPQPVEELHVFTQQELEILHPLDKIVQTYYVSLLESLYIASSTGGFYQFNLVTKILEEVFLSPSGISHFEVSPDSRLLAVATKEETLILFSLPDFDLLATIELGPQRPEGADDQLYATTIRWRWDSRYFAVNFFNGAGRRIRTYDDVGKLYAETEETSLISTKCLAWQPSGGLIGTLCTLPTGASVVTFFELNGLKRSDFDPLEGRIKDDIDEVLDLLWNSTSEILLLQKKACAELWVRSNYFWMCKKTIYVVDSVGDAGKSSELKISYLSWDTEVPYRLHVIANDGSYGVHEIFFEYSKGYANGYALVASVNGASVYSTPFRNCCAPPPKCMNQVQLKDKVQEVVLNKFWEGFLCIHENATVQFFKNSETDVEHFATLLLNSHELPSKCYNWTWPNKSQLVCISDGNLLVFELPETDSLEDTSKQEKNLRAKLVSSLKVRAKIVTPVFKAEQTKNLLVQKRCGAILLQELCVMPNILLGRLPPTVHQLKYYVTSEIISENTVIVFGFDPLTRQLHALFQNRATKILNDCTSFDVLEDWLLVTTLQGTLEVVSMSDLLPVLTKEGDFNGEGLIKYSRKVEKGSVIVTSYWNRILEPTVTLQILPRGNLETISPRPLIISSIGMLLKDRKYNEVMTVMRRHRLDFNVLAMQLKNLTNFEATREKSAKDLLIMHLQSLLDDVKDSHTVVLMVTELSSEHGDCVEYMKQILEAKVATESSDLTNPQVVKLVNPYLAVMAKLQLFEQVLLSPLITVNGPNEDRELVKSRIKFLGFYCENPDILYDSALGTYDLTLTSLVADCLNKDPKEYLPTLNEYQKLPKTKLMYTVDHKLKRYAKAGISLLQMADTANEEIISYTERYKIHETNIHFLEEQLQGKTGQDLEKLTTILELTYCSHGKLFSEQQNFVEAAICFTRGKDLEKSIDCYGKAGKWAAAVREAKQLPVETQNIVLRRLVRYLEELKNYDDAGQILEYRLNDPGEAFRCYIKGRSWDNASRLVDNTNLQSELRSELANIARVLQDTADGLREDIRKYQLRLRLVKEQKEKEAADGNFGDGDNFSDTESVSTTASIRSSGSSSAFSGKTFRSGKNTRKLKRKVYSLKEGSRFEDLAIIVHLWEAVQRVQNEIKPQVEAIAPSLWQEGLDAGAIVLISSFEQLLGQADECVKELWPIVLPHNELLDAKFCVCPPGWSPTWKKCSLISRKILRSS